MRIEDISGEVAFAIRLGMEKRAEAKALEEAAKVLKAEADELLLPLLETLDDEKVVAEEIGTVTVVRAQRSSFDKDKAKEELLARRVPASVVAEAFTAATEMGAPTTSVRFTPAKAQ